jgi:hypothetical protein
VGLAPTGKRRLVTAQRPILYFAISISYDTISKFWTIWPAGPRAAAGTEDRRQISVIYPGHRGRDSAAAKGPHISIGRRGCARKVPRFRQLRSEHQDLDFGGFDLGLIGFEPDPGGWGEDLSSDHQSEFLCQLFALIGFFHDVQIVG